jgi:hypothetical protein
MLRNPSRITNSISCNRRMTEAKVSYVGFNVQILGSIQIQLGKIQF